jgi:hypothetical protein
MWTWGWCVIAEPHPSSEQWFRGGATEEGANAALAGDGARQTAKRLPVPGCSRSRASATTQSRGHGGEPLRGGRQPDLPGSTTAITPPIQCVVFFDRLATPLGSFPSSKGRCSFTPFPCRRFLVRLHPAFADKEKPGRCQDVHAAARRDRNDDLDCSRRLRPCAGAQASVAVAVPSPSASSRDIIPPLGGT